MGYVRTMDRFKDMIKMLDIENRKKQIVEKYGLEPTVTFFYYLWNAIDYVGRANVKESFESISGLGDEVIVGDYSSNDGTKELAEECGLKVISVEKTPGITFHESKIINKAIYNSKSNFVVDLDCHTVYPKNLTEIIKKNLLRKDITKDQLVLRGLYRGYNGRERIEFSHCSSCILYKPYLLEVGGLDERTYYGFGTTFYMLGILEDIYKLEMNNIYVGNMVHRFHMHLKIPRWANIFDITIDNTLENDMFSRFQATNCLKPLIQNFENGRKTVKNSYW